jgi:hypothetical protein
MPQNTWVGFRFPARYLSEEEIDLLSPMCNDCDLSAIIVEVQSPLTPEIEEGGIMDIPDENLKYYCPYHAPFEVPEERCEGSEAERFEALRQPIFCPRREHWKVSVTCLRLKPKCLSKCEPIKLKLSGMSLAQGKIIAERGFRRREKEKEERKKREGHG